MSKKVFGKVIKFVGIAAIAIATAGIGALAIAGASLGAALGGTLAIAGLGTIGLGTLATLGIVAVSIGGALSADTPEIPGSELSSRLNISANPNAPRNIIVGTVGVSGELRYRNSIPGAEEGDPETLWLVLVLSGYPCDSLDSFRMNGEDVTLDASGNVASGTFAGLLQVLFRTGEETTQAFPEITAEEGAGSPWGAKARIGRGLCTAALKITGDEAFDGKIEPVFIIKGAKLYDPRKDTSVGGAGTHRIDDDTTFEFSNNPTLAKLMWLRGFYILDALLAEVRLAGRGLKDKPERFDFANWIESANIDDELVSVVGGGTIKRYECDGILNVERSWKDNLSLLETAQAGTTVYSGGIYRSYPAAWRAPTKTFNEADIIGVPKRLDIRRGPDDVINTVRGSFVDKNNNYEMRDFPAVKDATSIARVGEMPAALNLSFTVDHRAAQRIAKISMNKANAQRAFAADFTHRAMGLAPGGEVVNITFAHFDFVATTMRVTAWTLSPAEDSNGNPGFIVPMTLTEDMASFYTWTAGTDEQVLPDPENLPATQANADLIQVPGNVLAEPVVQVAGTGIVRTLGKGVVDGVAMDGDAINFAQPWAEVPTVNWGTGGKGYTASEHAVFQAVDLTTTGFTAKLRIIGTGTPSTQTDTTQSGPDAEVDIQIDKGIATEADNDTYTFFFGVDMGSFDPEGVPQMQVEFYTFKNGVGWTKRATVTYTANGSYTKSIFVDGLSSTSDHFGLKAVAVNTLNPSISAFTKVTYDHGGGGTDVTATPAGVEPVPFRLVGGIEGGLVEAVAGTQIDAAAEVLEVTGQTATIIGSVLINAATELLEVTGQQATIDYGAKTINAAQEVLEATPQAAEIDTFATGATNYDGSTDWIERDAAVTGLSNGKLGTVSFWIDMHTDGSLERIFHVASIRFALNRDSDNKFRFFGRNGGGTDILDMRSNTASLASHGWVHVLAAWDLGAGTGQVYIDDAEDREASPTLTDDTIAYTNGSDFAIGAAIGGSNPFDGCLSQIWFDDTYLDISVEANRRKFITAGGKPENLGSDGSTPTGGSPVIFMADGDETNSGGGGNFVDKGTTTACGSSPTD